MYYYFLSFHTIANEVQSNIFCEGSITFKYIHKTKATLAEDHIY